MHAEDPDLTDLLMLIMMKSFRASKMFFKTAERTFFAPETDTDHCRFGVLLILMTNHGICCKKYHITKNSKLITNS
jgi:hypothetical protein